MNSIYLLPGLTCQKRSDLRQGWLINSRKGVQCVEIHQYFEWIDQPRLSKYGRFLLQSELLRR